MRKFSKILESAESDIVLDIRDILMEFKDSGFDIKIDEAHGTYFIQLSAKGTPDAPAVNVDMMELMEMISVANERIKDLGMIYDAGSINISGKSNSSNAFIKLQYRKEEFAASKDVHGWKEFKGYCEKVLGIDGLQGADTFDHYFRINVVDKDAGWPRLPDDMAGWSIGIEEEDDAAFVAQFPGYEAFLKKLLSRQISYDLVWHVVDGRDFVGRTGEPLDAAKLEEIKKKHNPMKFDREGIEAVETLLEMAEKFPDKIEIKKHNI